MYIRYGCRARDLRANSVNSQSPKSRFLPERLTLLVRLLLRLQAQSRLLHCYAEVDFLTVNAILAKKGHWKDPLFVLFYFLLNHSGDPGTLYILPCIILQSKKEKLCIYRIEIAFKSSQFTQTLIFTCLIMRWMHQFGTVKTHKWILGLT